MKNKTLLATLGIAVGLAIGLENIGFKKRDCEVYQGYREIDSDISVNYVFDPYPIEERIGAPRYWLKGNHSLKNSLKIGERYCFELKDPIAPWASLKLISINQEPK